MIAWASLTLSALRIVEMNRELETRVSTRHGWAGTLYCTGGIVAGG